MTTTSSDVATIAPSAAPVKRSPPLSIMLNEILNEVDFSDDTKIFRWSDNKLEKFDRIFTLLDFFGDRPLLEALYGKASTPEEKRKAREWKRRHGQRIKNARKRISAIKQIKASNNKKKGLTPGGKTHKKKNTAGHVDEGCTYFEGASLYEFINHIHFDEAEYESYRDLPTKHNKLSEYLREDNNEKKRTQISVFQQPEEYVEKNITARISCQES